MVYNHSIIQTTNNKHNLSCIQRIFIIISNSTDSSTMSERMGRQIHFTIRLSVFIWNFEIWINIPCVSNRSSTIFSLLTSTSLMKKPQEDHIKRPMNAFMVSKNEMSKRCTKMSKFKLKFWNSSSFSFLYRFGVVYNEEKLRKIIQKCTTRKYQKDWVSFQFFIS